MSQLLRQCIIINTDWHVDERIAAMPNASNVEVTKIYRYEHAKIGAGHLEGIEEMLGDGPRAKVQSNNRS